MGINDYIGIPFKVHGRDKSGLDCYGLVRLFYQNELGVILPDTLDYIDNINSYNAARKTVQDTGKFVKIENPEFGAIGLFRFMGMPTHVGVYIPNGKLLHVKVKSNSVLQKIESCWLGKRLEGWYKFLGGNDE